MTETERNARRKDYFRAYAAANRARRREANRRWREKDRTSYNARQKANNERWRRAHGVRPRPEPKLKSQAKLKVIALPRVPKEKPKAQINFDPITKPSSVETLRTRFLKWRSNLP